MNNNATTPPSSSLFLRILGGGYLVYLAWDMRSAIQNGPLFIIAIILFAVVGFVLAAHSIWVLATHKYFRKDASESVEDREEESNE